MLGGGQGAPLESRGGVAAVLRRARSIAVTHKGTSGAQFARLVDLLDLGEALRTKVQALPGGGPMAALLAEEVDVAALPLTNVAPIPGGHAAALCPYELDVHIACRYASTGRRVLARASSSTGSQVRSWKTDCGRWGFGGTG